MTPRTATARRARAHERARRDILEAAARVFAQRGYVSATLAELAEAAGYAAPSLYRYFGSKEQIFQELLDLITGEVEAAFEAPVNGRLPLVDRLAGLFLALQRVAEGRRESFELLAAQVGKDDDRVRQERVEGLLSTWFRKHASRDELRVPIATAARVTAGILLAYHHAREPLAGSPAQAAHDLADLILNGVSA
jgi:AcrR family transcriptional regulator